MAAAGREQHVPLLFPVFVVETQLGAALNFVKKGKKSPQTVCVCAKTG
jgi:hypothetical protein